MANRLYKSDELDALVLKHCPAEYRQAVATIKRHGVRKSAAKVAATINKALQAKVYEHNAALNKLRTNFHTFDQQTKVRARAKYDELGKVRDDLRAAQEESEKADYYSAVDFWGHMKRGFDKRNTFDLGDHAKNLVKKSHFANGKRHVGNLLKRMVGINTQDGGYNSYSRSHRKNFDKLAGREIAKLRSNGLSDAEISQIERMRSRRS